MTGSGTLADPYIISDVDDLQSMENDLTAYYELANDIDASATSGWNSGAGFLPIGQASGFTGQLDGKGHTIDSLFINRPAENVGLFLYVGYPPSTPGVVTNLGLTNCDITGAQAGSIAWDNVGTISKCYATGTVVASTYAGGFVCANDGTIQNCYSRCSVTGDYAGGFVCTSGSTTVVYENCYSTGLVTATILGWGFDDAYGVVTNCFFDTEATGKSDGGYAVGKTTTQMKTKSTFTDADWDFTTPIWYINSTINDGYPAFIGVVTRIKGNPNIDQRMFQHVERMGR